MRLSFHFLPSPFPGKYLQCAQGRAAGKAGLDWCHCFSTIVLAQAKVTVSERECVSVHAWAVSTRFWDNVGPHLLLPGALPSSLAPG